MIQQVFHSLLEPAINALLKYDESAKTKISKLENKTFGVKLTDLSIQIKVSVINQTVLLSTNLEDCDCLVATSSQFLKELSDASQLTRLIKQDHLVLEGDLVIAQGFSDLLLDNNIDWQLLLSKYLGDAMAHRIMSLINTLSIAINRKIKDLDYTVSTALTEEVKLTPNKLELNHFSQQVDSVNAKLQRLEIELTRLRGA